MEIVLFFLIYPQQLNNFIITILALHVKRLKQGIQRCIEYNNQQPLISEFHQKEPQNVKPSQSSEYQKNKMNFPSAIDITRNNSVFAMRDKKNYKIQKLTGSINTPSYQIMIKKTGKSGEELPNQKIYQIIQRKNIQIQQSMNKERQSMSEIIYNFSKFRSMENNYYRNEKSKRKISKDKHQDNLKFPQLQAPKNNQQIFTIDYDAEGRKLVKVNIKQIDFSPEKKKSNSLLNQRECVRDGKLVREINSLSQFEKESLKNDLNVFKRKKMENQFGIQIKSINNRLLQNNLEYENGLKLRKELYQIVPTMQTKKKDKLNDLKKQTDQHLEREYSFRSNQDQDQPQTQVQKINKKQIYDLQNYQYNIVNTEQVLANNSFVKYKPKFTALSLYQSDQLQPNDQSQELSQSPSKNYDKQSQPSVKRQTIKRSPVAIPFEKQLTIYDQKINSYREFIFMINLAHRKFQYPVLREGFLKNQEKYKYYIGPGNNGLLVKSLMKRRFWWIQEDDYKKANCVWTQLKINNYFQLQRKSQNYDIDSKIQSNYIVVSSPDKKKKGSKATLNDFKSTQKGTYKAPLPADKDKIFTTSDKKWYESFQNIVASNQSGDKGQKYANRLKYLQPTQFIIGKQDKSQQRLHNHLQFNFFIGNKKALYYNLKQYYQLLGKDVFEIIPLTYHIKLGTNDAEYAKFNKQFKKLQSIKNSQKKKKTNKTNQDEIKVKNIWIVKPGQISNRGNGIVVIDQVYELINILKKKQKHPDGNDKTYIVQKYIERPLLYKGRKFDIRHYMIISRLHGTMRAYWYGEGYIRTSSFDFDLQDVGDQMIHLTNDAIQKNSTFYGKHEQGNKLSYSEFQKYLDMKFGQNKCSFAEHIYPKMKNIATDAVKSTYLQLDSNNMEHNFQVFGLDFMIDQNFNVWLIEVNTNPCLQLSSKLLGRIIPTMLEHAFRLTIDVLFPPPTHYPNSQKYLAPDNPLGRMMFQLIFDEARDGKQIVELYKNSNKIDYGGEVNEDDQVYDNDGKQIELTPQIV